MLRVSIIICCYNSAKRLPETLAHLAAQEGYEGIDWEVIVVDNASTDNTADVAMQCWQGIMPAPLKVMSEPNPGLSNARKRGIYEAKYDIVSFVDDDNWVCKDWVRLVSETMEAHPEVGACGGPSEAVCEVEPPEWFEEFKNCYAVGEQSEEEGDITDTKKCLWGAGSNFRKSALIALYENGFKSLLSGRKGKNLTSGEDTELCYALVMAGWRLWYDPELSIKHYISKGRLTKDYILKWHQGAGKTKYRIGIYESYLESFKSKNIIPLYKLIYWNLLAVKQIINDNNKSEIKKKSQILYNISGLNEIIILNFKYNQLRKSVYNSVWLLNSLKDRIYA